MNTESENRIDEQLVQAIVTYEGLSFEEAVLSYQARKNLPESAFCGPDRTYPAEDAKHVRNGFARLSTFGHRLAENVRKRIHTCLMARAKKFDVEHGGCWICKPSQVKETVEWYLNIAGLKE